MDECKPLPLPLSQGSRIGRGLWGLGAGEGASSAPSTPPPLLLTSLCRGVRTPFIAAAPTATSSGPGLEDLVLPPKVFRKPCDSCSEVWRRPLTPGSMAASAASSAGEGAGAGTSSQGLTLVHFSAQRLRFVWNRGCT